jgi:hypothetical protein
MTVTANCILQSKPLGLALQSVLTSTGMRSIIDKFTIYNTDTAVQTVSLYLVPAGASGAIGTASTDNIIARKALQPQETYNFPEIVGHILMPGDSVSTFTDKASALNLRISGRQVT